MLGILNNGIILPVATNNDIELKCLWCGKPLYGKQCGCTNYFGNVINDNHLNNVEKLSQILKINSISHKKFDRINSYYTDIRITYRDGYTSTLDLLSTDIPYDVLAKRTFALSMYKNFVGYIVDANKINIKTSPSVKFLLDKYKYVTILYNNKIYNIYHTVNNEHKSIERLSLNLTMTDKDNKGTYYKILQVEDNDKNIRRNKDTSSPKRTYKRY